MAKIKLNKTYSSFSKNRQINRANEVRRDDDTIKTPACTIYDVDYAIMSYIREVIHPQVEQDGQLIDVPITYANGEKWAQVQKRGYMRDAKGKLMTPLIFIKRNNIVERDSMRKLDVNINPDGNTMTFKNQYTMRNKYDRFQVLQGKSPSQEYFIASIPEYIDVSYELLIWTEYTEQLNSVIEQIMPTGGFAWGTTWKFTTQIGDYAFETMNNTGEDRIIRATLPLTTKASLLFESELRRSEFRKRYAVKKVVFGNEQQSLNANVEEAPPGGYDNTTQPNNVQKPLGESTDQTDQLGPLYQREIKKKRYSPL